MFRFFALDRLKEKNGRRNTRTVKNQYDINLVTTIIAVHLVLD